MKGVSKSYGRIAALRDVSLTIGKGVTGLIGPNGAGKSTLIKIILGLIKLSQGSIRVFEIDPWVNGRNVRRKVGILHEKPRFPGWATGYDFVKFVGGLRGLKDPGLKAEETLKLVGLWEARNMKIDEYSAGMVQRLGIAQALIGYPELIILDEPTANLDPKARLEVLETIRRIREERDTSFIISTHILPELERVCESVVIIDEGRIIDVGDLEKLASKYYAHSLTIKSDKPLSLMEWLNSLSHVRDITLKGDEITLHTSNIQHLMEELNKPLETPFKTIHVRENPGLLERIYSEATKRPANLV